MDPKSSRGLLRRLLEVAVVVGMDEVTGLHKRILEVPNAANDYEEDVLFQLHFKAHLLDIISGTQDTMNNLTLFHTTGANRGKREEAKPKKPSTGTRIPPSLSRSRSVRQLRKRANKEETVPVSTDFLSNLPYVCLPYDSRVFKEAQHPQTHLAVLTDVSGSRHYAVILRLFQPFYATKIVTDTGDTYWSLSYSSSTSSSESIKCYTPLCVCLVSTVPYFDVLKDALSCLYKEWKREPMYQSLRQKLEKYVTCLSVVPCPPPGIRITFTLSSCTFTMFPPDDINQQNNVVDIDLSVPLLVFRQNYQTLLQVLACILLEQRVVFVSNNHSLIVVAMQALLHYVTPFHWPHQYVPLLFSDRIDFVACPGIFLMGCHAMHKEKIKEVENDQILIDLDTGEALACASYDSLTPGKGGEESKVEPLDKVECYLPLRITEKVIKRLAELPLFDTEHLKHPTLMSFAEIHQHRTMKKYEMNRKIQNIFMDMMVDLFSNTLHYLDHEVNQFRTDEFFDTVTGYDRPFYIKVVKTYMFKKFVKERLRRTVDTFSKVANARHRRSGADKIRARRTFGKVRSTGENLLPILNRPLDLRSKTVVVNRRQSMEIKERQSSITRRTSMENKNGQHRPTAPILIRADIKDVVIETPPSTPVTRRTSSSECHGMTVKDGSSSDDVLLNDTLSAEDINSNIEHVVFNLPSFPDDGNITAFYKACVTRLKVLMNSASDSMSMQLSPSPSKELEHTHLASCLLLRGLYRIAAGQVLDGLEDLHETAKEDYHMFPHGTIKEVVGSLAPPEREVIRKQTYYKGDEYYEAVYEGVSRVESFYYSDDDLPYKPLDKSVFSAIVQKSSVTSDSDVISHLFNALSSIQLQAIEDDQKLTVDPETFAAFYSTWKQCRSDCEKALQSIFLGENLTMGLLRENETILKVSSVVTSNKGTGRLILTSEKLLFMTELYEECKLLVRLTQIDEVRIIKQKNLFRSFNAVSFMQKDDVLFRAALKNESELWKMIVDEMRIGRMLAKELFSDLKDHLMTLETAVQNVGVVEALYEMAVDEEFLDIEAALLWAKRLCNFTQLFESGQVQTLPVETNQMLLLTIDLSPKETKKSRVVAILFSPAEAIADCPHVWVTLSSSTIRMVDTTSWKLDPRPIKDCSAELSSLCMNDRELWVGSSDKTINLIDCESLRRTRVLYEHTAPVVAVFRYFDYVVSASSGGEVIFWDKDQKKKLSSFDLPPPHNNVFAAAALDHQIVCCCCSCSISLCTIEGDRRQLLTLNEFFTSRMADSKITCFLPIGCDEIWAGDSYGYVFVWRRKSSEVSPTSPLGDRHHRFNPHLSGLLCMEEPITCLMGTHDGKVWVGNSRGEIIILKGDTLCQERMWKAHDAAVTSLIQVENRYVISGSTSKDGKISLWRYEQLSRFT